MGAAAMTTAGRIGQVLLRRVVVTPLRASRPFPTTLGKQTAQSFGIQACASSSAAKFQAPVEVDEQLFSWNDPCEPTWDDAFDLMAAETAPAPVRAVRVATGNQDQPTVPAGLFDEVDPACEQTPPFDQVPTRTGL